MEPHGTTRYINDMKVFNAFRPRPTTPSKIVVTTVVFGSSDELLVVVTVVVCPGPSELEDEIEDWDIDE